MTDDPRDDSWNARSARGCDRRPIGPRSAYRWSPGHTPAHGPRAPPPGGGRCGGGGRGRVRRGGGGAVGGRSGQPPHGSRGHGAHDVGPRHRVARGVVARTSRLTYRPTGAGGFTPSSNEGYLCGGPGAMVPANGRKKVNSDASAPWVGRPIMLSDACGRDLNCGPEGALRLAGRGRRARHREARRRLHPGDRRGVRHDAHRRDPGPGSASNRSSTPPAPPPRARRRCRSRPRSTRCS